VDDGIHSPDRIDLVRDAPRLGTALQVPDYNAFRSRRQHSERCCAIGRPRVEHHPVTLVKERLRRRSAETVRTTRYENDRHLLSLNCHVQPTDRGDDAIHHPSNLGISADIARYRDRLVTSDIQTARCRLHRLLSEVRENDGSTRSGESL
jgi:hypothetical protein